MSRRDRRSLQVVGALAALLFVGALVLRASVGLHVDVDGDRIIGVDPETGEVLGGAVQLIPSANQPLFDDVRLLPGEQASACLRIEHRGEVRLDAVRLQLADIAGPEALLRALRLEVARSDGTERRCEDLEVDEVIEGPLRELTDPTDRSTWSNWVPGDGESATFRFTISLAEGVADALQGATATSDFQWTATARPTGGSLAERLVMLLMAVARDALLPILLLVVLGVLFLGIQDRIDRQDPKLALAAVVEEPEPFQPPEGAVEREARPSWQLTEAGVSR
jgi:hypothetical protein